MIKSNTLDWHTWINHGDQYFKGSKPRNGKVSILGPVIRYNLLSMALESYVMAMLDYHQSLPDNHTFTDLVTALDNLIPMDPSLKQQILKHESIQSICSVDKYQRREPDETELTDLSGAIEEIKTMAHNMCV